ncbi:MAG: Trk system potassium transporter TrkA [Clostridia bacterium]|nr:Trk system potassium transporter TrkA [Clostridia bacterium]
MRIIIAGTGMVGSTFAEQLSLEKKYDLVLIDNDGEVLEEVIDRLDVMAVKGNSASVEVLKQAGVNQAKILIAATDSDEVNLLCCMTAHALNPSLHTIARIRNPEYADQVYSMREIFGISMLFNPEKQAAEEIERLLRYPALLKRDSFVNGKLEIVELKVVKGSPLCSVSLSHLNMIVKCRVLVCAIVRDGACFVPGGNFVIKEGDKLFVTAPANTLSVLIRNLGISKHRSRRVTIVGGSTVAYYLADLLTKDNVEVQIIERDEERAAEMAELLPKAVVLCGDALERSLLERAGIKDADALISLTKEDEVNMVLSLYGNSFSVPQIITKLDRVEDHKIIDSIPMGTVVYPRKLCSSNIVRYVRALYNQTGAATAIHTIADDQAEAIEFVVDSTTQNRGIPLKNIKIKENVLICAIGRGARIEIPNGDSSFEEGDTVVIVSVRDEVIMSLNDIFH